MLPNPDDAVIWRGPRKNGLIKQFLRDVHWGALDFLVVDAPPGTSDEHISIAQLLQAGQGAAGVDGALIVTTPQEVSIIDVRKEVSFCRKVGLPVLGVVENMSGLLQRLDSNVRFLQPKTCSSDSAGDKSLDVTQRVLSALAAAGFQQPGELLLASDVFTGVGGGAARMCEMLGLRLLGRVPLDPSLGQAAEEGRAIFESPDGRAAVSSGPLRGIVAEVMKLVGAGSVNGSSV